MEKITRELVYLKARSMVRKKGSGFYCNSIFIRKDTDEIYNTESLTVASYHEAIDGLENLFEKYKDVKPVDWRNRAFAELIVEYESRKNSYLSKLNNITRRMDDADLAKELLGIVYSRDQEILYFVKKVNRLSELEITKYMEDSGREVSKDSDRYLLALELYEMTIDPSLCLNGKLEK